MTPSPEALYLRATLEAAFGPGWTVGDDATPGHAPAHIYAVRGEARIELSCRYNSGDPIYVVDLAPLDVAAHLRDSRIRPVHRPTRPQEPTMPDRILFRCPLPAEEIATILAHVVAQSFGPDAEPCVGVPYLDPGGDRWDLSDANDHKLHLPTMPQGPDVYAYWDRYHPPERMAFVRRAIEERGWQIVEDGRS